MELNYEPVDFIPKNPMKSFAVAYHKAVKIIFDVRNRESNHLFSNTSAILHLNVLLILRKLNGLQRVLHVVQKKPFYYIGNTVPYMAINHYFESCC